MSSERLWNLHQRHKFLRAEASSDILKFRVSEIEFSRVFKRYFPLLTPCCFVVIHPGLGTMPSKCPKCSTTLTVRTFHRSKPVQICVQCHSKLGNRCFTISFDAAYFLLVVLADEDESSQLTMAIQPAVLAGYPPLLTAMDLRYTCQLFLGQTHEVFVFSLPEFLKISDDFPQTSKRCLKCPDVPATFEHFQSYFKGGISVWCDKVKCLYETFLGILNLIFVINHVLKNISSGFVSQA